MTKPKHKYYNVIQVGDLVKYKNGSADYHVRLIHQCGKLCDVVRNNDFESEYDRIPLSKLEIITKNPKILSHKEIESFTMSKEYRDKTNPHNKVGHMTKPKVVKELTYLVTEYAPLTSGKEVHSHEVVIGKTRLADYILELDANGLNYLREVRLVGRNVKTTIKREVVIK